MNSSSSTSSGPGGGRDGAPAYEVFKHGWLKKLPSQERKLSVVMSPFSRPAKAEKLWVSFCVHGSSEPWLEFYENRRSEFTHRPISRLSLERCLHVSPSIRFHEDNEHVLAVTLETENVKLSLQSREQMIEWMDALRSKLRELGVLTPRDNLYSKEPEGWLRSPLMRNPNSPLPPTPVPAAFLFPPPSGLEFREDVSAPSIPSAGVRHGVSPAPSLNLSILSCPTPPSAGSNHPHSVPDPHQPSTSVVSYVRHHQEHGINRRSSFRASLPSSPGALVPVSFVRTPQGPQASPREHVTVINVAGSSSNVFNFEDVSAVLESSSGVTESQLFGTEELEEENHASLIDPNTVQLRVGNSLCAGGGNSSLYAAANYGNSMGAGNALPVSPMHQRAQVHSPPSSGNINHVNISAAINNCSWNNNGINYINNNNSNNNNNIVTGSSSGGGNLFFNGHSSCNNYEPLFMAFSEPVAPPPTPTSPTMPPQAPNTGLLRRRSEHRRSGRREQARRAASVGPSNMPRQPFPVSPAGHLMSLREQQVVRLQTEIGHVAGVRLPLRKKDCLNSIAFVNCFSQVFVAGWKQREHPYLHNTFHLGDRLISICGTPVQSASDAQALIRNEESMLLEFVVRRIPHGRVFALKRNDEGQPLGIVREGNTAEIKEVIPGGLAAREGLPPRAPTVDGSGAVSWVLTEINHRPLNLFFKHNEIYDRLNAVGRDISILVQPQDLVKQLKKQLKQLKNYKDYIVM